MYFTSKKGKWYNWAAQTKPFYRYIITTVIVTSLLCGWRFGIYAYLEDHIATDLAAIAQMNQQLYMLDRAQRVCDDISCRVPQLKNKLACYGTNCCTSDYCQKKVDWVIDELQKADLTLIAYDKGQVSNAEWYSCDDVHFSFSGALSNISRFFTALKQPTTLVQCKSFSCECRHDTLYNASCKLSFIAVN